MIHSLVHAFYERVRQDALLGPVFDAKVHDWPAHLDKLCDFWSGVLLATGRYKGKPMQMHQPLPIEPEHFERWLGLFAEVAAERCTAEAAALFRARAERIAQSLQMGIAFARLSEPTRLPEGVVAYKRTAVFTPETLPEALKSHHNTRHGVWGKIVVLDGCVRYTRDGHASQLLRADTPGVIMPSEIHAVSFEEPGSFYVEFYRSAESQREAEPES